MEDDFCHYPQDFYITCDILNLMGQIEIGKKIESVRESMGYTQSELAKILGTSQSAVARMEKGDQNFSIEMIQKIESALGKEIISLSDGSVNFVIEGGKQLTGSVEVSPSKNGAVVCLAASLLNKGKTRLNNVSDIEEVKRVMEVMESIGVKFEREGETLVVNTPPKLDLSRMNLASAIKTRSILLLMGPLLHHFKHFKIPQSGGCKLGERTVRPHLYALEEFGVQIETKNDHFLVSHKNLKTAEVVMYELSETATENAIMAAALIPGKTKIKLASSNYMVMDLCNLLDKFGVKIEGLGTSTLIIHGIGNLNVDIDYTIAEDPIDAMLFLSIAATTNSAITIKKAPIDFLELELLKLRKMGFRYKCSKTYKSENGKTNLVDIKTSKSNLVAIGEGDKIHPLPSNMGINIDNLPFFVPVAAIAKGQTLIHDWPYENRAIYYTALQNLGASIILADSHRIYINGPTSWRAIDITCPPALRPAAIILVAMLAAPGTSKLRNVYSILRGYEDLAQRLTKLGANIKTVHDLG